MAIKEIVIRSLGELIDSSTPSEPDPETGRRRDSSVYRGRGGPDLPLLTSLDCLGGIDPPHAKSRLEEHILRNFIRYSRPFLSSPPVNDWELLVLAQHHGLPTRLLDWTYSPLVAAHFATTRIDRYEDRTIWRLDWKCVHREFGFPELALQIEDLAELFGDEGPFTPWDLFQSAGRQRDFACMLEPPSLSARIVSQAAVFTLCSSKLFSFDDFLIGHGLGNALTRYLIPAADVSRVRDQLDMAGVDERRLFPDLAGLAVQVRRYYS